MGLIKAAKEAIKGTLADQWKEAIRCDNLDNNTLMVKKTTPNGVISNKSTIIVAPGQCAVIYDNGRVIDATAEEGLYHFDSSATPSFFAGDFGATFKEMWERFTYNGASAKQQAVFFFNTKEIIDNKFGTPLPIPFQDWSHPIPNQMTNTISPMRVEIKCFGKYTFKISNPALFMQEQAGTAEIYRKDQLIEQIRAEVIAVFQNLVNELGSEKHKVPVLEMPSKTDEIREMMSEMSFDDPVKKRGLSIVCFAVESVTLDEESEMKIDQYELSSNTYMQQGRLVDAYAEAVQSAAENKAGSLNGFMGIGMMNMATNGIVGGAVNSAWQNTQGSQIDLSNKQSNASNNQQEVNQQTNIANTPNNQQEVNQQANIENAQNNQQEVNNTANTQNEQKNNVNKTGEWACKCGAKNSGKFCSNCGSPKPVGKQCKNCKAMNDENSKFCSECGTKLE